MVCLSAAALFVLPVPSDVGAESQNLAEQDTTPSTTAEARSSVRYGVGVRARFLYVPKPVIELFVESAPSNFSQPGFGVEFTRKSGAFEIALGLEYAKLAMKDGIWIARNERIPQDGVDLVEFDGFSWLAAEVNFVWHTAITNRLFFRYGTGLGIGVRRGAVLRTDYLCSGTTINSCDPDPAAENIRARNKGIPPVLPILNAIVGLQLWPTDALAVNFETGFHTTLYGGITVSYFL